ncbi:MAG: Bax inhibitor-1/YccA family protein [Planctomycetota bacterium]|nr:Bax inhibitor-1/YccA family protein [Planctomycetota bacterium]
MKSGNPVLRESVFQGVSFRQGGAGASAVVSAPMSVQGTMAKTALLLLAVTVAATFTYQKTLAGANPRSWAFGGAIGGLILAMVISFKPKLAPMFALPYALLQGLFLGAISAVYAIQFSGENALFGVGGGIVFSAVVLTFAVSFAMFGLYAFRVIKVTQKLRSIVIAATAGVMFFYLISFVLSFFGVTGIGFHRSGPFGIAFSLFVVGLAAFNLLIDFDLIERGSRSGAPKYMEWFGAFALIVTLVWLYIELLRLLAAIANSRD